MSEGPGETRGLPKKDAASPYAEQLQEAPLSPEAIEKIMEKVQDIDTEGLGYSSIPVTVTKRIFQEGLLGADFRKSGGGWIGHEGITKESWAETARDRGATIHFNIVGRERGGQWGQINREEKREEYGSSIGASYYSSPGAVFIIFDLSKFKEAEVSGEQRRDSGSPKTSYEFAPNTYVKALRPLTKEQEIGVGLDVGSSNKFVADEYGFLLSSRVAPRFFQGVVFCPERKYTFDQIWSSPEIQRLRRSGSRHNEALAAMQQRRHEREVDVDKTKKQLMNLVRLQMEANADKLELLVPIYDSGGNLCWPKQMSHKEVKKFVTERDTGEGLGRGEEDAKV